MLPWIPAEDYRRRRTREVAIGDVRLGGSQPIRVQSMTTPPLADTVATVDQVSRLVASGCEIVRLTVPTAADAEHIPAIRASLGRRGLKVPLVADIHFSPAAALKALEYVEKVRVNPGNFADSKRFLRREYTDAEYASELQRLEEKLRPLVKRAREFGVAMRIGTNHGSLSDRILNRYGDTPLGMVESALEFVRICEAHDYRDLILSMKSSNPQITLQAYRLLAARMAEEGMDYPFHLGVTEAGDGGPGRIKSAIGIGSLLEEGIGDTIRVSLTEDPVAEIPVARALVAPFNSRVDRTLGPGGAPDPQAVPPASVEIITLYHRRESRQIACGPVSIGGREPVRAEIRLSGEFGRSELAALVGGERGAEVVSIPATSLEDLHRAAEVSHEVRMRNAMALVDSPHAAVALCVDLRSAVRLSPSDLEVPVADRFDRLDLLVAAHSPEAASLTALWMKHAGTTELPVLLELDATGNSPGRSSSSFHDLEPLLEVLRTAGGAPMLALRCGPERSGTELLHRLASWLREAGLECPLLLAEEAPPEPAYELLRPSVRLGGLLCDGLGDAVRIDGTQDARWRLDLAYDILQGARVRLSKTEFISCPSCGRTLFDLVTTTQRIKERTAHLKGVKIAIMGCVVNGPGEMADADFGYVGGAPGKVNLYVGQECVLRHVPEEEADIRLVDLIKEHGRWVDPPATVVSELSA
ncbi:MAG: (E)-4-hydroxy-3-methylbut-2-enyl-diphosphate synthase [Acidobacteriota bacterium]